MDNEYWKTVNGKMITVPNIDDLCIGLREKFNDQEQAIKRLTEENRKLKDKVWEGEEIARLKNENKELKEDLLRGFPITKEQHRQINNWLETHDCNCRYHGYSNVDEYRFGIIPGIGICGEAICCCGEKFCFQTD